MLSDDILKSMSQDELIELIHIYSKNWLAMDGAWFQAVERSRGMDEAMLRDGEAWKVFTVAEARRIKKFLKLPEQAGLDGLAKALSVRFYANINTGEITYFMRMCKLLSGYNRQYLLLFMEIHP